MPTDNNGNYSPPAESLAVDGDTALAIQHNSLRSDMGAALTGRLSRDGSGGMAGPLKNIDGTASVPSITFNSNTAYGFYKTATGVGVAGSLTGVLPIGLGPLPYSGLTAPPLWVLARGQQLSRTTYAELWAFAQIQIAGGNTLYNNGNGTTTFGIPDSRGRIMAGIDAGAGRLSSAFALGQAFGEQSRALVDANNGPHAHGNYLQDFGHAHGVDITSGTAGVGPGGGGNTVTSGTFALTNVRIVGGTGASGANIGLINVLSGTGTPFGIVQPTLTTNQIIYAGA